MIILLGFVVVALSIYEDECPFFSTYYHEDDGSCDDYYTDGCYMIVEDGSNYACDPNACMYGYYSTGTDCSFCTDNGAMTCSDASTATSCWDGYWLDGSDCTPCSTTYGDGCSMCTVTECTDCTAGWAIDDTDGVSKECSDSVYLGYDAYAATCMISDWEITVLTCVSGFGKNPDNDCVSCSGKIGYTGGSTGAKTCTVTADEITVTSCYEASGYCFYEDDSSCQLHPDTTVGLSTCTYNGADFTVTCSSNYGPCTSSGNDGCYYCGDWAIETCTFDSDDACSYSTDLDTYTCLGEGEMFVSDGEGSCNICGSGYYFCTSCNWDGSEASCTSCMDVDPYERGVYLDDSSGVGDCIRCGSGCHECVDDEECTTCMSIEGLEECYFIDDDTDDDVDDDGDDDVVDDDSDDDSDDDVDDDDDDDVVDDDEDDDVDDDSDDENDDSDDDEDDDEDDDFDDDSDDDSDDDEDDDSDDDSDDDADDDDNNDEAEDEAEDDDDDDDDDSSNVFVAVFVPLGVIGFTCVMSGLFCVAMTALIGVGIIVFVMLVNSGKIGGGTKVEVPKIEEELEAMEDAAVQEEEQEQDVGDDSQI